MIYGTLVYAIGFRKSGPMKIGVSDDLDRRLAVLTAHSPFPLEVFYSRNFGRAAKHIEALCHDDLFLKGWHSHNEWFKISASRAQRVIDAQGAAFFRKNGGLTSVPLCVPKAIWRRHA